MTTERNNRVLLQALGIGNFNATMMINILFTSPATTDPKSPQVMLLVGHIQEALAQIGYPVPNTGMLDTPTAAALANVAGPQWERGTWAELVAKVVDARDHGPGMLRASRMPVSQSRTSMAGLFDLPVPSPLPDVPGGLLTYGVLGFLAYKHFKRK